MVKITESIRCREEAPKITRQAVEGAHLQGSYNHLGRYASRRTQAAVNGSPDLPALQIERHISKLNIALFQQFFGFRDQMQNSEIVEKCRAEIDSLTAKMSALERQLDGFRRAEAAAKDEAVRFRFRSESLEIQLDNCLRAEERAKAAMYDQMTASLTTLEATIRSERSYLESRLSDSEAACRARDAEISTIYASLSWKITRPLRFIRRFF